ncbi:MAG: CpsD/CapB family tyrosine-protein kinase [Pseudomonadota bacterium]
MQRAREAKAHDIGTPTAGSAHAVQQVLDDNPGIGPPLEFVGLETAGPGFDAALARSGHLLTEIRALKRKILEMTHARREAGEAAVVIITSAVPGDGKSFVSLHLALSLTHEKGMRVTLVDGDVARQKSTKLFSAAGEGSLAAAIIGDMPLAKAVHRTKLPGLTVVPAGEHTPAVSECLASSRWDGLLSQMRAEGRGRVFIVDTAPILATSESQYAARTADLVLFVVRAEVTPKQAIDQALVRLGDLSRVAFVLNATAASDHDPYYEYSNYGTEQVKGSP